MTKSRIEELEDENAELRYRLGEIEASMAEAQDMLDHIPGLTATERRILALLVKCGRRSSLQIERCIYADRVDPPHCKSIHVYLHKMRLKLAPLGIEIRTYHGVGFELTPASLAIIKRRPHVSECAQPSAPLRATILDNLRQVRVEQEGARHD